MKLGKDTKKAISINELAYELEKAHPNLNFFEINSLLKKIIPPKCHLTPMEFESYEYEEGWICKHCGHYKNE